MAAEEGQKERILLGPEESVALWLRGREAWNKWAEENPKADVSFQGVDFSKHRDHPSIDGDEWPFEEFCFPSSGSASFDEATFGDGDVSFFRATFGDGAVSFLDATFGDGDVSFVDAAFGDGDVRFSRATFGDGDVRFSRATFGDGEVWFMDAAFGDGDVSFVDAAFGDGDVSFVDAAFGDGDVSFVAAAFGDRDVRFSRATFGDGDVWFSRATFGDGDVWFMDAAFGDGGVSFVDAAFGDGVVWFSRATFGDGAVSFESVAFGDGDVEFNSATFGNGDLCFKSANFGRGITNFAAIQCGSGRYDFGDAVFLGRADFSGIINAGKPEDLSFRFCVFASGFSLSADDPFNCVPDFVGIKAGHHFSLEGFTCSFASTRPIWFLPKRAKDERDSERLRRLKELATDNRDFAKALDFNAEEIRASRWHSPNWRWKLIPEFVFWAGSDYGRSIGRAAGGLAALWFVWAAIYAQLSVDWAGSEWWVSLPDALAFSASQMYGYLPGNRESRVELMATLFANQESNGLFVLTNLQSAFTIIGTFLLGLTLRNRFKM